MGRSASTVCDEWSRNRVHERYDPKKAHHKAYVRRKRAKYQGMRIVEHDLLRREVHTRLYDDQSPEAIAGWVRKNQNLPRISKNAIYRYIASVYGRRIETHRFLRRRRRRRGRARTKSLSRRAFIDKRPKKINARSRIGDAETDFIVSGKSGSGILLVVVDRRSRTSFLAKILPVSVSNVHAAFLRIKQRFSEMQTLTMDNDILFQKHEELARLLGVRIFFCHPYHSWEKGTVENTNKVIRQDIPKGANIAKYSKRFITNLEAKLNRRPMQCLGYQSPGEVLRAHRLRKRNKKHRL